MKLHEMKEQRAKAEETELPSQPCCECGRKLSAPWGRNGYMGKDWVCSRSCQERYESHRHG